MQDNFSYSTELSKELYPSLDARSGLIGDNLDRCLLQFATEFKGV
jgi:hypothetical protein